MVEEIIQAPLLSWGGELGLPMRTGFREFSLFGARFGRLWSRQKLDDEYTLVFARFGQLNSVIRYSV
jgi:hypothetical protein